MMNPDRLRKAIENLPADRRPYLFRNTGELRNILTDLWPFILAEVRLHETEEADPVD